MTAKILTYSAEYDFLNSSNGTDWRYFFLKFCVFSYRYKCLNFIDAETFHMRASANAKFALDFRQANFITTVVNKFSFAQYEIHNNKNYYENPTLKQHTETIRSLYSNRRVAAANRWEFIFSAVRQLLPQFLRSILLPAPINIRKCYNRRSKRLHNFLHKHPILISAAVKLRIIRFLS